MCLGVVGSMEPVCNALHTDRTSGVYIFRMDCDTVSRAIYLNG